VFSGLSWGFPEASAIALRDYPSFAGASQTAEQPRVPPLWTVIACRECSPAVGTEVDLPELGDSFA
jgi:hypothetical protein